MKDFSNVKGIMSSFLFVSAIVIFGLGIHDYLKPKSIRVYTGVSKIDEPEKLGFVDDTKEVLSHPLIPGGTNLISLRAMVKKNPQLAKFYISNGFDLDCSFDTSLPSNEWATVSFRRGKDILWSSKRILLLKGESVIEDCHGSLIRGKCGNLVYLPEQAVEFDTSPIVADLLPDTGIEYVPTPQPDITAPIYPVVLPVEPTGSAPLYPPLYPPFFCCGNGTVPLPPTVPEPTTISLVAAGLLLILGYKKIIVQVKN